MFDVDIKYFFVCMYMKYIVRCTIHVIINALRSKISMAYKIVNDLTDLNVSKVPSLVCLFCI